MAALLYGEAVTASASKQGVVHMHGGDGRKVVCMGWAVDLFMKLVKRFEKLS